MTGYSQNTKFQRIIGGSGDDRSYSVAQTKDGGYILTGYTKSAGSGGSDVYLTKTDGLGKPTWSKAYGTSGEETGWKVKQTSDSGYIVAGTTSSKKGDGFIFKTDANGSMKWGKIMNSDSVEDIYNVIESRSGDIYVTGYVKTDSAGEDGFLTKYTSSGSFVWHRTFGAGASEEAYSLVEEQNGNIAVLGVVKDDTITAGGRNGSTGDEDFFIARFKADGKNLWIKNFGTLSRDQAWDIKYSKGEYVVTGWTYSGSIDGDVFLTNIDTSGNVKSGSIYTCLAGSSRAFSVIVDPDNSYSLTGYVNTVPSGRELFYLNINSNGSVNTGKLMGGKTTDGHWPSEVLKTMDGGYTLFSSSNSFKTNVSYELYMVRTDDKGNNDCNQSTGLFSINSLNLQSYYFGAIRQGLTYTTLSFNTANISSFKDSVLCCKLQAQVVGPTVRICKGESVRIGKAAIPGYTYKWTSVGGSFSSSESSPQVNPSSNTTYKLVVSSADGKCTKDSATVALSIRADLKIKDFVRDTFFCSGDTVTVKARSGAIDYKWLGSVTNMNGQTVKLTKADVIVVTYTDTTTCKYNDTFKVTKKNLPVFKLGNDTTICDNTKITLVGPDKMKTYSWNSGQATTRSFATSEQRTHTLAVADSFGCKYSATRVIFTNPASTFTLGPDTAICTGINHTIIGPAQLTNYFWNGVSTFNPHKTINTPGVYICQAQNSYGCIHIDTIVVKKKPDPTFSLGPDGGVCASGGRKLKGPDNMKAYQWSDNSTSQNLDVFFAGVYWLKVTGTNGCIYTDSVKMTIVQNPTPNLGKDTIIEDCDSIYLDAGNYVSFLWSTNETTRIIKVKKANLYTVKVTDVNTCTGESDKKVTTKPCTRGISYIKIPGLKVTPNPAKHHISIQWLSTDKNPVLQLLDLQGKIVVEKKASSGLNSYTLDVSEFSRGVYYLKVSTETTSQTVKIILD